MSKQSLLLIFVVLLIVALFSQPHDTRKYVDLNIDSMSEPAEMNTDKKVVKKPAPTYSYQIQKGDNLSSLFSRLGFAYSDLSKIMEEDLNHLSLDTLKPGNTLKFWADDITGKLMKMELEFNPADRVQYVRTEDDNFTFEDISVPGEWKTAALVGNINGSFSSSANKLGLSIQEIEQVSSLLQDKLNFGRDLRAGDKFSIVHKVQYVDGKESGNREIEAINIYNQGRIVTAYLHTDGQYYDDKGDGLQRAFDRYPTNITRITSNFNPNRLHPVTGRSAPHNGTDFGTPIGTPIRTIGDGKVIMVRNHPYAGKYVVVEHGATYKTRYLHMSKIMVKKGQQLERGQVIGLSGKTGRVTGPHLHFELLIRNRPVNAMTAAIPMAESVPKEQMTEFAARRDSLTKMMEQKELLLAQAQEENNKQSQSL